MSSRQAPKVLGEGNSTLDGQEVSYTVKRSSRARNVRLEVRGESGLTIVVPGGYSLDLIPDLLRKKKRWVLKALKDYVSYRPATPTNLKHGDVIPYLGGNLEIVVVPRDGAANARLDHGRLIFCLDPSWSDGLNPAVEQWYRAQAAALLEQKISRLKSFLGWSCNRITVRGQRTRWGSCSHKGNLSFNWRLLMAPENVVDYVVIHELCHLKEMNHTAKFWDLVARYCPDWRERRKWLKDHQRALNNAL